MKEEIKKLENLLKRSQYTVLLTGAGMSTESGLPDFHELITTWQRQGFIQRIITQNVDGFHQQASSHEVIELHGSLREVICHNCKRSYPSERYMREEGTICLQCQGFLRPNVVLFGETLSQAGMAEAIQEAKRAELFIVLGSSLQVSPANTLPIEAVNEGALFVIINEGMTSLDEAAHLKMEGKIGDILSKIML